MSFFNLNRSQEDKSVKPTNEAGPSATRARELPLPVDIYEGSDALLLLADLPGVELGGLSVSFEDDGSNFVLRADVPGLAEKDFQINVAGNTLTLRGERKLEVPEGHSVHRRERVPFRFDRSFDLPARVDAEKATATLKLGVLTLTLPKVAEAQPRQIVVKAD